MLTPENKSTIIGIALFVIFGIILGFVLAVWMAAHVTAQEIIPKKIVEFSGGLVTSIDDTLMQDNQAKVLDNYIIDKYGRLRRRPGVQPVYKDALAGHPGLSLIPYYGYKTPKELLYLRNDSTVLGGTVYSKHIASLMRCDDDAQTCTDNILAGPWLPRRRMAVDYNYGTCLMNNNLVFAAKSSEPFVYDGNNVIPFRPHIVGQPYVYAINGEGSITGIVRYRYKYTNAGCSDASTPSFPLYVENGKVWIEGMIPPLAGDSIRLYRQDNLDGGWHLIGANIVDSFFVDTFNLAQAAGQAALAWKIFPNDTLDYTEDSCGPGGLIVTVDTVYRDTVMCFTEGDPGWFEDYCHWPWGVQAPPNVNRDSCHTLGCDSVPMQERKPDSIHYQVYAVIFADSAGRHSYMTPPTVVRIDTCDAWTRSHYDSLSWFATITNIPVVPDTMLIKHKYLMRMLIDKNERFINCSHDSVLFNDGQDWEYFVTQYNFIAIAELEWNQTSYTDSIPNNEEPPGSNPFFQRMSDKIRADDGPCYQLKVDTQADLAWNKCDDGWDDKAAMFLEDDTVINAILMYTNDDSLILFQPTVVVSHGSRLAAIGNPQNRNSVYFSQFGRPSTWPVAKIMSIASHAGDYFINMMGVGNTLVLLRQNSIVGVDGLGYSQYTVRDISRTVGLSAARSLAGSGDDIYFAHNTGVYHLPGDLVTPISWPIETSLDSAGDWLACAWGGIVNAEYWLSVSVDGDSLNDKTYIYDPAPKANWRSYDFGILSAAVYDYESDLPGSNASRYLFLLNNDSIFTWNYNRSDSLDDTSRIYAKYQSKAFFYGPEREFIFYVDLMGTGSSDSLYVLLVENNGNVVSDTNWAAVDFSKDQRHRFKFNTIVENVAVQIGDHGHGDYYLTGYEIGWLPWDSGRNR